MTGYVTGFSIKIVVLMIVTQPVVYVISAPTLVAEKSRFPVLPPYFSINFGARGQLSRTASEPTIFIRRLKSSQESKVMKCPGCEGEAFVYATRDVSLNAGNPDDVVPDVKGDHCIHCGAVIMNVGIVPRKGWKRWRM